jgi:hypothetical protein
MRFLNIFIFTFSLCIPAAIPGYAQINQDDGFETTLPGAVEVKNAVYKPVVALGAGTFNFMGDVKDFHSGYFGALPGFRFNVSSYIDNLRNYRLNFFMLYGNLSGNERSYINHDRNLNFKSEIINFGLNFEYTFNHLFRKNRLITPFFSVGAESLQFNSKADLLDSNGNPYNYWSDGTIRNIPERAPNANESVVIQRNYIYETDLRRANLYGMGDYPQRTFAIPVDYGLDFRVSDKINLRIGSSMHFTFTDMIDNVSKGAGNLAVNRRNDRYSFSYVTLHLDLFSEARTVYVERHYADVEFDHLLAGDEDNDGVPDFWDKCPNTPPGVAVDQYGCPVDSDGDGVPDYLDLEPNTRAGAFVDGSGREITAEELAAKLSRGDEAMSRHEMNLHAPLPAYRTNGLTRTYTGIPGKFRFIDIDGDGFISFGELIRAINNYFDGATNLSLEDINELNVFFFSQ